LKLTPADSTVKPRRNLVKQVEMNVLEKQEKGARGVGVVRHVRWTGTRKKEKLRQKNMGIQEFVPINWEEFKTL